MVFPVLGFNIGGAHGIQQRNVLDPGTDKQRHDEVLGKIDVELRHDGNSDRSPDALKEPDQLFGEVFGADYAAHIEKVELYPVCADRLKFLTGRYPIIGGKA